MRIALCHDALIPPKAYGGAERVIFWLAKALTELGHQIALIAKPGSAVPGARFYPHVDNWPESIPSDVDIVHLWSTPRVAPLKPFVVTIEGNGQPGEVFHPNTLFISKNHAENHGAHHYVYNGIDPSDYTIAKKKGDTLVFLAKASWKVKNLDGAIAVARAAGMKLEVMGSRDLPLGLRRFLPSFGGVRYHGMVGDEKKREILSRARGLLFPVRWHEPFGIAILEALASGCAVFGTPYGSLSEIVTKDVGHLSSDGAELVAAVKSVRLFSPERCRQRVSQGFTHLDMARAYLKYYERVLSHGTLDGASQPPITRPEFRAAKLLPWMAP